MSAPPIGMMIRKPSPKASSAISQNSIWLPVATNATISTTSSTPRPRFSLCWPGKVIGAPLISACSLANAISEPEKVMAPIARPERHLDQALRVDVAQRADAERFRRVQRRRGDEDRRQADQRMEGRDQLRQRRHLDAQRDERADARRR